jgi:hypothetical protein
LPGRPQKGNDITPALMLHMQAFAACQKQRAVFELRTSSGTEKINAQNNILYE